MEMNSTKRLEKSCSRCKMIKPYEDFSTHPRYKSGRQSNCRKCSNENNRIWGAANRDKKRLSELKFRVKSFGLTLEELNDRIVKQDNKCAICKNSQPDGKMLAIDHDHITGQVRDLLCSFCNTGLGLFRDNEAYLKKAAKYIKKHSKRDE